MKENPSIDDIMVEARRALHYAAAMLEFFAGRLDLDGAAISYLACQQLSALLATQSRLGAAPGVTITPNNDDSKAFIQGAMTRALELSKRDEPAVVTLGRLKRYWEKRFKNAPAPIQPMGGENALLEVVGAGKVSGLTSSEAEKSIRSVGSRKRKRSLKKKPRKRRVYK